MDHDRHLRLDSVSKHKLHVIAILGLNLLLQPCLFVVWGGGASRGHEGGGFLLRGFLCFIFWENISRG